jgi:hypothetical protein
MGMRSALLSRRSLLRRAVGAAGAATTLYLTPDRAIGAPKLSQRVVAYQDHPEGDRRCENCAQFQPPDTCKVVEGTVSPQGYCRFFTPIRQSLDRSGAFRVSLQSPVTPA